MNVVSGSNITISDNNFVTGSNNFAHSILVANTASNVTIINNNIDGAGLGGQGLVASNGVGTTTIEYNKIVNAFAEPVVIGTNSNSNTENWVIQYNVIGNAGYGYSAGAHGDWIQAYNAPGTNTNSVTINYNTFLQTVPIAQARTQGLSLFSANSGSTSGVFRPNPYRTTRSSSLPVACPVPMSTTQLSWTPRGSLARGQLQTTTSTPVVSEPPDMGVPGTGSEITMVRAAARIMGQSLH